MQHIRGISRNQITIDSLESSISANNPIRFIDAFVGHIDLKALGFEVQTLKTEGRPSFDSKILLKLYLYGYFKGRSSSRKLEKVLSCLNVRVVKRVIYTGQQFLTSVVHLLGILAVAKI